MVMLSSSASASASACAASSSLHGHRAVQHEVEAEPGVVALALCQRRSVRPHDTDAGDAIGGLADAGFGHFETFHTPGLPPGLPGDVAQKALATEIAPGIDAQVGQLQRMVGHGDVFSRCADLHHFGASRAAQHAMANPGRLQHTVISLHHERFTLVLVDHAHPAFAAEDGLKAELVEVQAVRHRPAVQHPDMRCDECAAVAFLNQVAVAQPGATHAPMVAGACTRHHQGL